MVASPETLITRARARTGLVDLGPDGWQEGLGRLVDAVGTDLGDDPAAVAGVEELIVGRLATRLRVEEWHAAHAADGDDAAPPVEGPLVIVGLPRTATTALHHLLSLDPQFRYLRRWELKDPVPPPDAATEADDPRRPAEAPAADVRHITAVDGPAEDGDIHTLQFRHGEISLPVPTYTRWWVDADHRGAFAYHERFLRMLHAHRPPTRWLLKFPAYLFQLPELAARYPDARFVVTHRDPLAVVPSTCSVVLDARRRRVPGWSPDPDAFGQEVVDYLLAALGHAAAGRRALGEDRFLDVGQHEIEDDALAVAERVYAFAGLELDDGVRAAMTRWAGENRRGARGEHRYRVDDYGLSEERVEEAFAGYVADYGEFCRPRA